ncbi:hypothetical protein SAMN03159382_01485 [Pseudomonas sp. NFACC23-1]|uniref:hypothetical protein n=1 Tax=unclassified Pseudomonas TaxID=196821 RepID=UPI00088ADB70|nr:MULTISPECIES: hypothetical protein [unclassified Pseudomonas]SDB16147.1 hypothetical protein SAMN03159386_01145 [Pseudomonas sp. NFACC17-2]SEJ18917.1 hypothetical protein SAMN03159382_01485 [Pseudomonas sp. NFACC23-1]SFW15092.1 hypothetical protein SAMN05660640_00105 [Pseudomonas sp. NFACC16-2]
MSESVPAPQSDQDPTTKEPRSAPATVEKNKQVQDTAAPVAAPVVVWRTLMLEQ